MKRALVRAVFRIWIGILLAAQFAVAAHACVVFSGTQSRAGDVGSSIAVASGADLAAASQAMAPMAHCDGFEASSAALETNLCAEHCRLGQQGDQAQSIHLPVTLLSPLYPVPGHTATARAARRAAAPDLSALVAAAPPHAILHCVRRT